MNRRTQILEKALEMFNERGVHEVGVREIARALNISVGNLSYHFPKKEDIITALMAQLRDQNTHIYQEYIAHAPALEVFLQLLQQIFQNQYAHRGVLIAHPEVKRITGAYYDYNTVQTRRKTTFEQLFDRLREVGHLQFDETYHKHLVDCISLWGRFWIHEAFIDARHEKSDQLILHYLKIISRQLALFATETGKTSLERFWAEKRQEL